MCREFVVEKKGGKKRTRHYSRRRHPDALGKNSGRIEEGWAGLPGLGAGGGAGCEVDCGAGGGGCEAGCEIGCGVGSEAEWGFGCGAGAGWETGWGAGGGGSRHAATLLRQTFPPKTLAYSSPASFTDWFRVCPR